MNKISAPEMNLSFVKNGALIRVPIRVETDGIIESVEITVFVEDIGQKTSGELFQAAASRAQKIISTVQKAG